MTVRLPEVSAEGLVLWRVRQPPRQELWCCITECCGEIIYDVVLNLCEYHIIRHDVVDAENDLTARPGQGGDSSPRRTGTHHRRPWERDSSSQQAVGGPHEVCVDQDGAAVLADACCSLDPTVAVRTRSSFGVRAGADHQKRPPSFCKTPRRESQGRKHGGYRRRYAGGRCRAGAGWKTRRPDYVSRGRGGTIARTTPRTEAAPGRVPQENWPPTCNRRGPCRSSHLTTCTVSL